MEVPLLDLKLQYAGLKPEVMSRLEALIDSQLFILGPEVESFEREVAEYSGAPHAVGVSSGTDAQLLILMALGVGPGDAVITSPYTFFATAGCIARLGATPVFIDIDPATYNLSPEKLRRYLWEKCRVDGEGRLLSHAGQHLRAIIPVHLFGLCCALDEIAALAREYKIPIIEDAAQALGADYPSAAGIQKAGTIGEFGFYSFFPSKNLGAFGDAGMVVCRDAAADVKMRALRNHGMEERYFHRMIGGNFRLDALQAAVLRIKLPHLDEWSARRREHARLYREEFARRKLDGLLKLPGEPFAGSGAPGHHIYNQFVIRAPRRDALCEHLRKHHIGHAIYYPLSLHEQECFAPLGYRKGDFPESEKAASESLALPIFPELARDQQLAVVGALEAFYR